MQNLNEIKAKLVGLLPKLQSLENECLKVLKFKENPTNGKGNEKTQNSTDFFGAKAKPGASPFDTVKNLEVMGNLVSGYKAAVQPPQLHSTAKSSEATLNMESLVQPEDTFAASTNAMMGS